MTTPSLPAVEVENLSKRYTLGSARPGYRTVRDALGSLLGGGRSAEAPTEKEEIWALRDVSFTVNEGEALGILGRNGAGKSTLLKILSRITEPTAGRARLRGRVSSLLEVGTGFHPELTGRENIYLNGAILGMRRAEIDAAFHDIVAFAEVERFLDTPVKRYSSGMYVRLAFAVAAHLTPEILIVDEVLAVGDAEFQKRCLGRMGEVARSGRTVLFVSHNMTAIESLCTRALLVQRGRIGAIGSPSDVIARYLSRPGGDSIWDIRAVEDREGTGSARITRIELLDADRGDPLETVSFLKPFRIRLHYEARKPVPDAAFLVGLLTEKDERVFLTMTQEEGIRIALTEGPGHCDCVIRAPNVLPGRYKLEVAISDIPGVRWADHVRMVGLVEVVVGDHRGCGVADLGLADRGRVYIPCEWTLVAGEVAAIR